MGAHPTAPEDETVDTAPHSNAGESMAVPLRSLIVCARAGEIARRLANVPRDVGDGVTLADTAEPLPRVTPRDSDSVIVSRSVNCGRHQLCIRQLVGAHGDRLNGSSRRSSWLAARVVTRRIRSASPSSLR